MSTYTRNIDAVGLCLTGSTNTDSEMRRFVGGVGCVYETGKGLVAILYVLCLWCRSIVRNLTHLLWVYCAWRRAYVPVPFFRLHVTHVLTTYAAGRSLLYVMTGYARRWSWSLLSVVVVALRPLLLSKLVLRDLDMYHSLDFEAKASCYAMMTGVARMAYYHVPLLH